MKKLGKFSNGVEINYKITDFGIISYECKSRGQKIHDKQLSLEELYMFKCLYEKVLSENFNEVTINNDIKFINEN